MFNSFHTSVHSESEYIIGKYSSSAEPNVKVDEPQYWTVWESKLQTIYYSERITFLCIFCVVTFVAAIGNILTLLVVITRKQRLLFKTCLLSLALSDLIYATSCGANYISKLIFDTSTLWYLGKYGCTLIPFFQTASLLSGSMSLVSIALDRYMAIFNKRKSQWQPGVIFCSTGIFIIWAISCSISSPMLFSYEIINIYVVPEIQENFYVAQFCLISNDDKDESLYYYCIIFIFVFLPLFVTFVSFNAIIAREIYKRRKSPAGHDVKQSNKCNETSTSSTAEVKSSNDTNTTSIRNNNGNKESDIRTSSEIDNSRQHQIFVIQTHQQNNGRCNERQRRQMRMFKVILVIMCVFIMLRLPTWLFLLYKLNFRVEARIQWLINYSLSIVGIMNSSANPFLYTFLSETIRVTSAIRNSCHTFFKLCRPSATTIANDAKNTNILAKNNFHAKQNTDNGGVYLGNQQ